MDLNGFNANDVEPNAPYVPIPANWYRAVITKSEEKATKDQTGGYLQLNLEVIEGEYAGRVVIDRLHLNPSPGGKNPQMTLEIAQRTLSAICRAVGVMTPRDSSELHDKPLMVKVAVRPEGNGYDASNEVKGYEPVAGGGVAQPVAQQQSQASTPPWKR